MLPGTVGPSVHCNQRRVINSFPAMCVDIYMLCRSFIALRMSKLDLEYLAILIWKGRSMGTQLVLSGKKLLDLKDYYPLHVHLHTPNGCLHSNDWAGKELTMNAHW